MDAATIILGILTTVLFPWMFWTSRALIAIQIKLARGEETFDKLEGQIGDHETRIRTLESFHYQSGRIPDRRRS